MVTNLNSVTYVAADAAVAVAAAKVTRYYCTCLGTSPPGGSPDSFGRSSGLGFRLLGFGFRV